MKTIVTFKSKYGHAKAYAIELARLLGAEARDITENADLSGFEQVAHVGGIYAGIVSGVKKAAKRAAAAGAKQFCVVTVGMTNPDDKAYYDKLSATIKNGLPDIYKSTARTFNMRGGIDYESLSGFNRLIMKFLINSIKKTPPEKRTPDTQAMLDSFGKKTDLSDMSKLEAVAEALNN